MLWYPFGSSLFIANVASSPPPRIPVRRELFVFRQKDDLLEWTTILRQIWVKENAKFRRNNLGGIFCLISHENCFVFPKMFLWTGIMQFWQPCRKLVVRYCLLRSDNFSMFSSAIETWKPIWPKLTSFRSFISACRSPNGLTFEQDQRGDC